MFLEWAARNHSWLSVAEGKCERLTGIVARVAGIVALCRLSLILAGKETCSCYRKRAQGTHR